MERYCYTSSMIYRLVLIFMLLPSIASATMIESVQVYQPLDVGSPDTGTYITVFKSPVFLRIGDKLMAGLSAIGYPNRPTSHTDGEIGTWEDVNILSNSNITIEASPIDFKKNVYEAVINISEAKVLPYLEVTIGKVVTYAVTCIKQTAPILVDGQGLYTLQIRVKSVANDHARWKRFEETLTLNRK